MNVGKGLARFRKLEGVYTHLSAANAFPAWISDSKDLCKARRLLPISAEHAVGFVDGTSSSKGKRKR